MNPDEARNHRMYTQYMQIQYMYMYVQLLVDTLSTMIQRCNIVTVHVSLYCWNFGLLPFVQRYMLHVIKCLLLCFSYINSFKINPTIRRFGRVSETFGLLALYPGQNCTLGSSQCTCIHLSRYVHATVAKKSWHHNIDSQIYRLWHSDQIGRMEVRLLLHSDAQRFLSMRATIREMNSSPLRP